MKKAWGIDKISALVGVIVILGGAFIVWGQTQEKIKVTEENIGEIKEKIEKNEIDIDDLEDFSIKQTILMERQIKIIEKLEKKVDEPG